MTYGASPRGPAAVPSGCAAGGTNGCGDSRWTGAGTASCDADGPCGTTWVGAERDGWAAGRGFMNGSFISTASLPATGRAAAHDASGAAGQPTGATHTCSGRPTVWSGRRSSSRASSRTSTSVTCTGSPTRTPDPAGRLSAVGESAASSTSRPP